MPKQLHSVNDPDFQSDVALYPSPADWRYQIIYSLTDQATILASEKEP